MGVVASNFQSNDGGMIADLVQPSSQEWISKHAQTCRMSESEVRKRWDAFQKLGCDVNGHVTEAAMLSLKINNASTDALFIDKMLEQFPKTETGGLSFQTYCNAAKWFSDGNTETRIRGAFRVLNKGNALDAPVLQDILREIYVDTSEAVIERTAQVFLKEVDAKGQGSIDEADFVAWVQRMPSGVVEEIMRFGGQVSSTPATSGQRSDSDPNRPSVSVLSRIAENAKNRDWLLLVNKLGFTEEEIKEVGDRLGNKKHDEQLFELLKKWRSKPDAVVTMETLKEALVSSGMEDIAAVLKP